MKFSSQITFFYFKELVELANFFEEVLQLQMVVGPIHDCTAHTLDLLNPLSGIKNYFSLRKRLQRIARFQLEFLKLRIGESLKRDIWPTWLFSMQKLLAIQEHTITRIYFLLESTKYLSTDVRLSPRAA